MDDVILKEWAELASLALQLNDHDKFPIFLEMSGHAESFNLRVGNEKGVTYLRLPITSGSEMLSSLLDINESNIKAAKEWLTARHSDMVANAAKDSL